MIYAIKKVLVPPERYLGAKINKVKLEYGQFFGPPTELTTEIVQF